VPRIIVPGLTTTTTAATAVGQLVGKPLGCDVVGQEVERGR